MAKNLVFLFLLAATLNAQVITNNSSSASASSSGTVTSVTIAGTTNQITATGTCTGTTTISCTFSIPSGLVIPGTINGLTITTTTGTLTITNAKTVSFSNTMTFAGTDGITLTFPTTSATIARTDAAQTFTGIQTFNTPIARASGGLNSNSAGTGILRDGTTPTASELSGDCTTSGSNAVTCTKANGGAFPASAAVLGTNGSSQPIAATTTGSGTTAVLATSPTITTPAITTSDTVSNNGIGATSTDGDVIQNTTAAANNTQQWSPRTRWIGQGWKTNATAGTQTVYWRAEVIPYQDTTSPDAGLTFTPNINSADQTPITFCNVGTAGTGVTINLDSAKSCAVNGPGSGGATGLGFLNAGNIFGLFANTILHATLHTNGMTLLSPASAIIGTSSIGSSTTGDVSLQRDAAGLLSVYNGTAPGTTAANYRDFKLRHLVGNTVDAVAAGTGISTTPTISGTTILGSVAIPSSAITINTIFTVTFATAFNGAPNCMVVQNGGTISIGVGHSQTASVLTVTAAIANVSATTYNIDYACMGN